MRQGIFTYKDGTKKEDILFASKDTHTGTGGTHDFRQSDNTTYTANDVTGASTSIVMSESATYSGYPAIYADLSSATSATINQLRQAFATQTLYERDARGGTRYTEIILSHFGVHSPDQRLQRAEYLGGSSDMINISPVANQSSGTGSDPVGDLAAMGTLNGSAGFTKSFTEHGTLMMLVNVRGDITYQQGLNRMWSRSDKLDFYWPALAQLGEQAVLSKEIYSDGSANDSDVWGYQEAFAEMRYKPSLPPPNAPDATARSLIC